MAGSEFELRIFRPFVCLIIALTTYHFTLSLTMNENSFLKVDIYHLSVVLILWVCELVTFYSRKYQLIFKEHLLWVRYDTKCFAFIMSFNAPKTSVNNCYSHSGFEKTAAREDYVPRVKSLRSDRVKIWIQICMTPDLKLLTTT